MHKVVIVLRLVRKAAVPIGLPPFVSVKPTASRAEKCPSTCAECAPEAFGAEKGIFSGAEWDTNRLPSRKMPLNLRGGCSVNCAPKVGHNFVNYEECKIFN